MEADEAFARYLLEQDMLAIEAMEKADRAMANQLQSESVIDLTEEPTHYHNNNTYFMSDYALALRLQKEDKEDLAIAKQWQSTIEADILNEDNPDLHQLFMYFNKTYFNNMLDTVQVNWSKRMTSW